MYIHLLRFRTSDVHWLSWDEMLEVIRKWIDRLPEFCRSINVSSRPERPLFFPPVRRGGRVGGRGVEGPAVRRIGRISLYHLHRLTPVRGQVFPRRILALDQPNLLFAAPAL